MSHPLFRDARRHGPAEQVENVLAALRRVGHRQVRQLRQLDRLLGELPRLLESGSLEGRKEFVRAFVGGITVRPDSGVLDVQMKKFPELGTGNLTCDVVAGARYVPVQIELRPLERFVAGLRRAA